MPIVRLTTLPSKQSITGDRYTLPAGMSNSEMSVTVVTRAPSDSVRALAPYTLLLVDLDEGTRVMAHGTPGLAIGDRVSAHAEHLAGMDLIIFHRSSDP